jgi:hypothetical protein
MMVGFVKALRTIFSCRSQTPPMDNTPPPEYKQICGEAVTSEKPGEHASSLLNPGLRFTAADIESHLVGKDQKFAAAVVELMLPRLKVGVWQELVGWGHYSYTLDKVTLRARGG